MIFGVTPKPHDLVGQDVSEKTLADIATELGEIEPAVQPLVERVPLDSGKHAIVVQVTRGYLVPYSYRGRPYRRITTTTSEMPRDEYNRILRERLHTPERWETETAERWTVADLDVDEVERTFREAVSRGRAEAIDTREPLDFLRALGLTRDGVLLRAAVALFARADRLLPDYPQCLLQVARFRGVDKTEFHDNRQFRGHAFKLIRDGERFILDNLPIAGRVVPESFRRVDEPLYPPVALREALANALCHRDYASPGGVTIGFYDDRLEITSPGWLHFGLEPADLFVPHESRPWNPTITDVFYRCGVIEKLGRGTLKMAELTERAGLPRPEIARLPPDSLLVRFRPSRYVAPQRIGHNLTPRQQAILDELGRAGSGGLALGELVRRMGGQQYWAVKEDLPLLRQLGLIGLGGHGRGAHWYLRKEGSTP